MDENVLANPGIGIALTVVAVLASVFASVIWVENGRRGSSWLFFLPIAPIGFFGFIHSLNSVLLGREPSSPSLVVAAAGTVLLCIIVMSKTLVDFLFPMLERWASQPAQSTAKTLR